MSQLREAAAGTSGASLRLPPWLRRQVPRGPQVERVRRTVALRDVHTVCESAACPNRLECYSGGKLTFMILGNVCTRNCAYCKVSTGKPLPFDWDEPKRVADAANDLALRYVVITSVCRDDLADGGADQFALTINTLRERDHRIMVEVLIPDFKGSLKALESVLEANPTVLNHNVETVPRLYHELRPQGRYDWALELLGRAKSRRPEIPTKSGLMLGLGERKDEVLAVLRDLRSASCDVVTLGQYVRPSLRHKAVEKYWTPDEFAEFAAIGKGMGFAFVASGPLVRSSFMADEIAGCVTGSSSDTRGKP